MPSLDYIEKLTGIKEDWIQNLKETESALVLAGMSRILCF